MPEPDPLITLLDIAADHARRVLITLGEDQLAPLFHLCGPGSDYLVPADFYDDASKDEIADKVRKLIRRHNIIRYSFLSEAWMITRPPEFVVGSIRPAEADDRIEVVIAIATDGVDYKARRWRIKRHQGKCIDLVLDSTDGERPSRSDRFGNLFPRD